MHFVAFLTPNQQGAVLGWIGYSMWLFSFTLHENDMRDAHLAKT